jgi:hypothetical protein
MNRYYLRLIAGLACWAALLVGMNHERAHRVDAAAADAAREGSPIVLMQHFEAAAVGATLPATRPVLGVGSSEPYKTLADALAHARDGDTILLADEVFDLGGVGLSTGKSNLTITATTRATIRYVSPAGSKYVQQALMLSGSNVTVSNINFDVTNSAAGAWSVTCYKARGVTLKNCVFTGTKLKFDGVQSTSAAGVTIDSCTFDTTEHYSTYAGSADGVTQSSNLTILNSTYRGAGEHCVRTHGLDGLLVDSCTVDNTWDRYNGYHGGALNIRDGKNVVVRKTTVYGSFGLGPLPQSPATMWLDGVSVTDCKTFGSYFAIEPNTINVKIDGLELHSDQSGNALNIKGATGGKVDPTGTVANVRWEYAGGRGAFCNHMVPSIAWANIAPFVAAPATVPSTRPADVAKALAAEIKAMPGLPTAAAAKVDQLARMVK